MPGEGFEPPTFGLQNRCTTTVLTRRWQTQFTTDGRIGEYTVRRCRQLELSPHFHNNSHIRNTCASSGSASGRSMVMSLV